MHTTSKGIVIISSFIIKYYDFFKREMLQKDIILL